MLARSAIIALAIAEFSFPAVAQDVDLDPAKVKLGSQGSSGPAPIR